MSHCLSLFVYFQQELTAIYIHDNKNEIESQYYVNRTVSDKIYKYNNLLFLFIFTCVNY